MVSLAALVLLATPVVVVTAKDELVDAALDATHAYWLTANEEEDPLDHDVECTGGALWRTALSGRGPNERLLVLAACPHHLFRVAGAAVWLDDKGMHALDVTSRKTRDLDPQSVWNAYATDARAVYASDSQQVLVIDVATGAKRRLPLPRDSGNELVCSGDRLLVDVNTALVAVDVRDGGTREVGRFPSNVANLTSAGGVAYASVELAGVNPRVFAMTLDGGPARAVYGNARYTPYEFVLTLADARHVYVAWLDELVRVPSSDGGVERFVKGANVSKLLHDERRVYWLDHERLLAAPK